VEEYTSSGVAKRIRRFLSSTSFNRRGKDQSFLMEKKPSLGKPVHWKALIRRGEGEGGLVPASKNYPSHLKEEMRYGRLAMLWSKEGRRSGS